MPAARRYTSKRSLSDSWQADRAGRSMVWAQIHSLCWKYTALWAAYTRSQTLLQHRVLLSTASYDIEL